MRVWLFYVLVALTAATFSTPAAPGQSLGDLARQEAERRKTVKDSGRVLTNKDVPRVAPSTEPAVPTPPAQPDDNEKASGAAPGDKPLSGALSDGKDAGEPIKDQNYWSDRQRLVHEQLDRDQIYLEAVRARLNTLTADFISRSDPMRRTTIAAERQKTLDDVARLDAAIAADKAAVAAFEDEAHRSAVPPGWLR